MDPPRAIIDFEGVGSDERLSFDEPFAEFRARDRGEVAAVLERAEAAALGGAWVVGFLAYEAAPGLDPALSVRPGCRTPLAWFGAFDAPAREPRPRRIPHFPPAASPCVPDGWTGTEDRNAHARAVGLIREAIGRGDVYQVNHTFRLRRTLTEPPSTTYERLLRSVPAPYSAYLRVPPHHVISISPELFFRRDGDRLTTRPMKGTAPRGRWPGEDDRNALGLERSEKDRAENLMIVDLLRNDLGRVARLGSVHVRDLFRVERHATVHQMTSTVVAEARPGVTLADVVRALFPCGSVTGAPKIAATGWIARLEGTPRDIYCGAVGIIQPGGDCTFSVAIRTALADDSDGTLAYGVGGGVTWSSSADGEWREALGKAAILNPAAPAAALLETLRVDDGEPARWAAHRHRLLASAAALGHRADARRLDAAVAAACAGVHRNAVLRLTLAPDGTIAVTGRPPPAATPLTARLADVPVDPDDLRLYHKTTDRSLYDAFRGGRADDEDVLLWNTRGEATEFTRGNLVAELDGRALTPPVNAGLLPGVFREELVRSGRVAEATVTPADLDRASAVWFVNSVREWVEVRWNPSGAPGVAR